MKIEKEEVKKEVNYLNPTQQARLNALSARDEATLTGAEKRELEDLNNDSKLTPAPTVGYQIEGTSTIYVPTGVAGKTVVAEFKGTLANIQGFTQEDFNKKFEVVAPAKPVK